jgi:AcrR family transcriptional regulator
MNTPLASIPLRARKRARTRIALVEALLDRLVERPLDAIQVAELVEAVDISPATFFNYFPSKPDLLTHYIQLWSLQVGALARTVEAEHDSALAAIEALITSTAELSSQGPNVMMEIIVHQARNLPGAKPEPVEPAERMLYLPDVDNVEELSDRGLASIITDLLNKAVARGELPPDTDIGEMALAVGSTFYGVHLIMATRYPEAVADLQRRQLKLLWAGAWALARKEDST